MFGSTVAVPLMLAGPSGITDPVDIGKLIATMFFERYHHHSTDDLWKSLTDCTGEPFPSWHPHSPFAAWLLLPKSGGKFECSTYKVPSLPVLFLKSSLV